MLHIIDKLDPCHWLWDIHRNNILVLWTDVTSWSKITVICGLNYCGSVISRVLLFRRNHKTDILVKCPACCYLGYEFPSLITLYNMNIGVCQIHLDLPSSSSLKDKRKVIRSVIGRVQSRFSVAIAEVDCNDSWKSAVLGVCCVSNDPAHANKILSNVVEYIISCRVDASIRDYETEIISGI